MPDVWFATHSWLRRGNYGAKRHSWLQVVPNNGADPRIRRWLIIVEEGERSVRAGGYGPEVEEPVHVCDDCRAWASAGRNQGDRMSMDWDKPKVRFLVERVESYDRKLYQLRLENAQLRAVAVAAQALLDAMEPYATRAGVVKAVDALRTSLAALEETRGTG